MNSIAIHNRYRVLFLCLLLLFTLAACGGGAKVAGEVIDEIDDALDPDNNKLKTFDVVGTSADIENPNNGIVQAPIDPAMNNGDFYVKFTVKDEGNVLGFEIKLYVSSDENLSESTDEKIYTDLSCTPNEDCGRNSSDELGCNMNNSNVISCDGKSGTNLTDFLSSGSIMTDGAYIIIKTCNYIGNHCDEEAHPVRFL